MLGAGGAGGAGCGVDCDGVVARGVLHSFIDLFSNSRTKIVTKLIKDCCSRYLHRWWIGRSGWHRWRRLIEQEEVPEQVLGAVVVEVQN